MRQIVRQNTRPYTIHRITDTSETEKLGAAASSDYTELDGARDLYCYGESESRSRENEGDVVTGTVEGVALPDQDLREGDRLDYGSYRYEIVTITERQSTGDGGWLEISLERT